jgi:hypothetical protein
LRKEKALGKGGFRLNSAPKKRFKLVYLLFLVPFLLAFLSWAYFPTIAQGIIANVFGYRANEQVANPVWLGLISFFYTWYTFLAIGFAGMWIVAAFLARRNRVVV